MQEASGVGSFTRKHTLHTSESPSQHFEERFKRVRFSTRSPSPAQPTGINTENRAQILKRLTPFHADCCAYPYATSATTKETDLSRFKGFMKSAVMDYARDNRISVVARNNEFFPLINAIKNFCGQMKKTDLWNEIADKTGHIKIFLTKSIDNEACMAMHKGEPAIFINIDKISTP